VYCEKIDDFVRKSQVASLNIWGGRGTGKTTVLRGIYDRLQGEVRRSFFLDGRNRKESESNLRSATESEELALWIIDDIDELLKPGESSDVDTLRDLVDILFRLVNDGAGVSQDRKLRLIVSTTGKFYDPLNPSPLYIRSQIQLPEYYVAAYSLLAQQFQRERINPWETGWRERWRNYFREIFKGRNTETLKEWAEPVMAVTGGHPSLFGPVCERLKKFELDWPVSYWGTQDGALRREQKEVIRGYVEEWIEEDGVERIKRMLKEIKNSPAPGMREAFSELARIAHSDHGRAAPPESSLVREILSMYAALAYHESGSFVIPGIFLQQLIRRYSADRQSGTLEVIRKSERRGTVREVGSQSSVEISGDPWSLFQLFDNAKEEIVPMGLLDATFADKKRRNNALARLRVKLAETGWRISGERGQGYRLVRSDS
jgi:hypothetical protein